MKKAHQVAYLLFALAAIADLWMISSDTGHRYFTKPLLMPLLALGYGLETRSRDPLTRRVLAALFFSWLGDIFLMLEDPGGRYFIIGLVSFLTAHLCYIWYFSRIPATEGRSFVRHRPILLLAVLAYVVELLYVLWPHLGGMKVPVLVYGIVIGTMLCFAFWQYGKVETRAARLLMLGAFLFVVSDSLLAINKFRKPLPYGGFLVMLTYILAQYAIVRGSARERRAALSPASPEIEVERDT